MIWLSRQKTSGGHSDSIIAQRNNLTNLDIIDDNNIDTPNKTPRNQLLQNTVNIVKYRITNPLAERGCSHETMITK